ncbi:MAG: hypothetical protein Q8P06_00475 [Candidatus Azambacteria bacterium]|nr:hypothetical protein [Candidatus Azambacteria bacterium]
MASKNLFTYPKAIYNEQELLGVYRIKFPQIVRQYEVLAKKTYCNPAIYKKIVKEKSKKFDTQLRKIIREYEGSRGNFSDLIKISIALHKNYAFNFWLISYVIGEGPIVLHYVNLLENILKKLYSDNDEKFLAVKAAFLKTDFEIFYHKILMDSIKMIDFLNKQNSIKKLLGAAKKLPTERRIPIYNKIISELKRSKETNPWVLHILEWHNKNTAPIYNMFNQGIDYYKENLELKSQLEETSEIIKQTFRFAKKKLNKKDFDQLKKLYNLIREMIIAKDFIFGRKDIKLFYFWKTLNQKLIDALQKEFGKKISLDINRGFLVMPWDFLTMVLLKTGSRCL